MIEAPMPAGNPMQAPAPTLPFQPGMARPLSDEQVKAWQGRIQRASAKAELFHPQWERALKRYAEAKVSERKKTINALLDYRHVESKKSQLYHRTPEINLSPKDPTDPAVPYNQILPLREKFLNHELGPERAKAKRALHKTLVDTLAASGWMVLEVGFEQVSLPLETTEPGMFGQPPTPKTIQVPVWSRRFMSAISSKRVLVPDDFHDTDFDDAPWLGYKGTMALSQARRAGWQIPQDYEGSGAHNDVRFLHDLPAETAGDPKVPYTKIWYRAAHFDPLVFNPDVFRCLVLIEGLDAPAWHVDSPYQTLLPTGELSDDSMIGNPIHMDSIRDLIDSAYVPSDLVVGEQLSEEINQFRTGQIRGRQKRQPVTAVSDALGQPAINKILAGEVAVLPEDRFTETGVRGIAVIQGGTEPRDNYTAQEKAEQDWEQALGVSPNQAGSFNRTKRTATEVREVSGNSSARAETDKDRVRDYVIGAVRKFDVLVQRTATQQEIVKVLGQQGGALWQAWRALPGTYAYKVMPDAGQYVDAKEERQYWLQLYELTRKDPLANGAELLRGLYRASGQDPMKMVPQDQTEEKPEPLKLSASISVDNAMALPAEMELLLALLEQQGYAIPPGLKLTLMANAELRQRTMQMEQTAPGQPGQPGQNPGHGGPAAKVERISKHQSQRTGGVQGVA